MDHSDYITDLSLIAAVAAEKENENDHFLQFALRQEGKQLDALVHQINEEVSARIDCTQCGNCCKTLMINVTAQEVEGLSAFLGKPAAVVKAQYIEESLAGNYIINTIPCSFLSEKKCTIYTSRFTECREFPHLHKDGFKERLAGTLMYYSTCPIIYNVIERVKITSGFLL